MPSITYLKANSLTSMMHYPFCVVVSLFLLCAITVMQETEKELLSTVKGTSTTVEPHVFTVQYLGT